MNDDISIRLVDSWPTNEIIDLYKAGGWWKDSYDPSLLKDMIIGSFAFAVVVDTSRGKAIGMGRVLSDGISDAYIQDLIILPDYRNNGLGKKLVNFLIKKCLTHGIVWIGVIAEPGSENFYNKFGFKQMMGYTPMLFKKVD
jgi:GNAT superfamily N-acetyltransferase